MILRFGWGFNYDNVLDLTPQERIWYMKRIEKQLKKEKPKQ